MEKEPVVFQKMDFIMQKIKMKTFDIIDSYDLKKNTSNFIIFNTI